MSDSTIDWIWSKYTISPNPASGMQSLHQTCSALTKHVLLPSHIVLSGGSFTLLPELTEILTDVIPLLGQLLNLAMQDSGLPDVTDHNVASSIPSRQATCQLLALVWHPSSTACCKHTGDRASIWRRDRGLASLQAPRRAAHNCTAPAPDRVSQHMHERQATHTPRFPFPTPKVASACLRESVSGPSTSMDDLVMAYHHASTSGWSLSSCAARIMSKRLLNNSDIEHRRSEPSSPYFGHVRLDQPLFASTEKAVVEMQRLLTAAFAPTEHRPVCFLVDPHGVLTGIFRGTNCVNELQVAWKALCERLEIAQCRFAEYCAGYIAERMPPAELDGDCEGNSPVSALVSAPPPSSGNLFAKGPERPGTLEASAQASSFAVTQLAPTRGVTSSHSVVVYVADGSARSTAVDLTNSHASYAVEVVRGSPSVLAIAMTDTTAIPARDAPKIQQVKTALGHAPAAAIPAAVKDPPHASPPALTLPSMYKPSITAGESTQLVGLDEDPEEREYTARLGRNGLLMRDSFWNIFSVRDDLGSAIGEDIMDPPLLAPPSDPADVEFAPKAATPASVKDPPCNSLCDLLLASTCKPGAAAAAEDDDSQDGGMDENPQERGLVKTQSSPTMVTSASIAAASLPAAATSMLLGVSALPSTGASTMDASTMTAAQLPALSTEIQKVVLAQSCSLKNEADLGGQVGQQSEKKSIAPKKLQRTTSVPRSCLCHWHVHGRAWGAEQSPNKKKEAGHTFEELAHASDSPWSLLSTFTSLNLPSYSFGSLSRDLSDLSFVTANLGIALVSTIAPKPPKFPL
ncbi:hypothetical protein B0H14DRAFT_3729000 [Mycena olivaceomarginata]|nr:hypothetical protein B0H14DRAFT_3729000 [Mycena olivaceomarginata]